MPKSLVRRSIIVSVVSLCTIASSACANKTSNAIDACTLLAPETVAAVTGLHADDRAAQPLPTGSGKGCSWGDRKHDGTTTVLVNVATDDSHRAFVEDRAAAAKAAHVEDLPGKGDEAFAYVGSDGAVRSAEARVGSTRVQALVEGPGASQASALQVLGAALGRL